MGWQAPEQPVELVHLAVELTAHGREIGHVKRVLAFPPDIPVQADREPRTIAAHGHRFLRGGTGYREAGARHDTVLVTFQDAAIQTRRGTKIVCIDYEVSVQSAFLLGWLRVLRQSGFHQPTEDHSGIEILPGDSSRR